MKIALLTEKYTPDIGGLAISSERLARLLSSAGHDVRVFSPSRSLPPSEKRTLTSSEVSVTRFGAHKRVDDTLVDWLELIVEEHKREPFDVLHAYFLPQAGFVASYAGKYLGIPSVVSIRGNDIERAAFDPSKFSHVMYALQNASEVTSNANELIKKTKAFIDREIHLIPNGIDAELYKPMPKNDVLAQAIGIDDNPVLGFVGELREKKGLQTILRAYTQINKGRATTLLIVGEVRQGDDLKAFNEFKLSNPKSNVIVTSHVPHHDLPSFYSLMDVFVHPSLRDGMPNAVLEAMACGKAVIATPVGGIKDVIEDEKNGIIVNVNDANIFEEKILELLDDSEKRKLLGTNARELIVSKFTLENELEANLNIYRKLGI